MRADRAGGEDACFLPEKEGVMDEKDPVPVAEEFF